MDKRHRELKNWLTEHLEDFAPGDSGQLSVQTLAGDASFRRYFRVRLGDRRWVAMDAPPDKEDCRPFVRIARHWRACGIQVPDIVLEDLSRGFLLLTDFGDQLLSQILEKVRDDEESTRAIYSRCIDDLLNIQATGTTQPRFELPPYGRQLLNREMVLFSDWLVSRKLGLSLSGQERLLLLATFEQLTRVTLNQPRVPVHRDYHSRNILVVAESPVQLGHIDFQDAVLGPITYDLVSLLRDCYIKLPHRLVDDLRDEYYHKALDANLLNTDQETFATWFDWMGIQRHLKASGIFARLALRDHKPGYLKDVPRTLSYIQEVCNRHEALHPFCAWLERRVLPALPMLNETS